MTSALHGIVYMSLTFVYCFPASAQTVQTDQKIENEYRVWTNSTGTKTFVGRFVQLKGSSIMIKLENKTNATFPVSRLSQDDQAFARKLKDSLRIAADFRELKRYESEVVFASEAVELYKRFVDYETTTPEEKNLAEAMVVDLEKLAKKNAIRVGNTYLQKTELDELRTLSSDLIKDALGLARTRDFPKAEALLKKVTRQDASNVEALFILAMTDVIDQKNYKAAILKFGKCVRRAEKFQRVYSKERRNLAAAIQNLALLKIRDQKVTEAVELLQMALQTDNSVSSAIAANSGRAAGMIKNAANASGVSGSERALKQLEKLAVDAQAISKSTVTPVAGWVYVTYEQPPKAVNQKDSKTKMLLASRSNSGSSAKSLFTIGGRSAQIDNGCMFCAGLGTSACNRRGCANGTIRVTKTRVLVDPATGNKAYQNIPFPEKCPTCRGSGRLDCRACDGGVDKRIY